MRKTEEFGSLIKFSKCRENYVDQSMAGRAIEDVNQRPGDLGTISTVMKRASERHLPALRRPVGKHILCAHQESEKLK